LHQPTKPALFALLVLPYAFTASVTVLLMPYLLRKHGASVDQIAGIVAVANLPTIWAFLWSPLADAGPQRRVWIVLAALGAGLAAFAAILNIEASRLMLTSLLLIMNIFGGLLSSACGALLSAMPSQLRGHAAGWYQGANTGGAAVGGALLIWLADRTGLGALALLSLAAMVLPTTAVLCVTERSVAERADSSNPGNFIHDIRAIFLSPRAWIGLVFLLSPVGSSAAGHLISGMGQDYRTTGTVVVWVTGIGGGLAAAAGSLIGGATAARMGRLMAYPVAGALSCLFGLYLGFGGATPVTYAVGYSGYSLAAGFAYAVYTAIVLDIVGGRHHAAASGYALLNSAGNIPIVYMTWLDGLAYRQWGARGTMTMDAAANGLFSVLLLAVALLWRQRWKRDLLETQLHA
jgi:MFS transporter, PAT family, beta-lactamase induction signal transducer AmpG